MKYLLIVVLIVLVFGGGGARLRRLISSAKAAPKTFKDAKRRDEDPVGHAKEVSGRTIDIDR
ncbi:MAG TPA: hypothetical protein VGF99_20445 [Myxococcota bacterium]